MNWDPAWEGIYSNRDWGHYPPEELVRFIARNYYTAPDHRQVKIMELGCGVGANIWYLAREGFDAHAIDGSATAIDKARSTLKKEGLSAQLTVGDVATIKDFNQPSSFDAIIDIVCLQHNDLPFVREVMEQSRLLLKPGGIFFTMMVSDASYGYGTGQPISTGTFRDMTEGPMAGLGLVHFFNLEEINSLMSNFIDVGIEYSTRTYDNRTHILGHWVAQGTKE